MLAPPSGLWQQGNVLAVTGHQDGAVNLWKAKPNDLGICIDYTLPKTHRMAVTILRLTSDLQLRTKTLVQQIHEPCSHQDLMVGDASGYVSRWTPFKLDQLSGPDAQRILEKFATEENLHHWTK